MVKEIKEDIYKEIWQSGSLSFKQYLALPEKYHKNTKFNMNKQLFQIRKYAELKEILYRES